MNNISTAISIISAATLLIAIGFLLMTGEGSSEQAFHPDIFSIRRTVIAPVCCLAGYLLIIVGIIKKKE